jgi:hypothetical protein
MKKASIVLLCLIGCMSFPISSYTQENHPEKALNQSEQPSDQGIFSSELMEAMEEMMTVVKAENESVSEEEIYEITSEKIYEKLQNSQFGANRSKRNTYYDHYTNLLNQILGPTERKVCSSNRNYCAKVLLYAKIAFDKAKTKYNEIGLRDGIADAYRHGLWQALSAFYTSATYAKQFGDAHEIDVPNDSLIANKMDKHNNAVGRRIGASQRLEYRVYHEVENCVVNGGFLYIKNSQLTWTNQ